MRIAYENIIDSLTSGSIIASTENANFPIENVQDQRLSTKWKSTGATDESVIFTLNTMPEIPDDPAGITYLQDAWATIDGWSPQTGAALTVANGKLVVAAGNGGAFKRDFYSSSVLTYILKINSSAAGTLTLAGEKVDNTFETFFTTSLSIGDNIINTKSTTGTLYTGLSWAISGSPAHTAEFVYVGTGAYLASSLPDLSGNGNHFTVYAGSPDTSGYLLRNGASSYERSDAVLATVPDEWYFEIEMPSGNAQMATIQSLANYKVQHATIGFLWFYRPISSDALQVQYTNGTAYQAFNYAAFFTGYTTTRLVLGVYYNWITGAIRVYRNGTQFGATQYMTTPVKPTAGSYLYLGAYQGTQYFAAGTFGEHRIYNRDLTEAEATNLYNGVEFITQYDGLVGWYKVDYGLGVNTVSVLGHNIKTGTEVRIQANNSNEWSNPSLNETLTVNPNTILKFLTQTYYYKYWKFYFAQGLIEIGRLWLGEYLTITPSSLLDFNVTKMRSDTITHGKNRQKFASEGISWRKIELSFPRTEEAMIYQIDKMYDYVGNHSSTIFCNFDSLRDFTLCEPCYCSINGDIGFSHLNRMSFTYSLELEEEK